MILMQMIIIFIFITDILYTEILIEKIIYLSTRNNIHNLMRVFMNTNYIKNKSEVKGETITQALNNLCALYEKEND